MKLVFSSFVLACLVIYLNGERTRFRCDYTYYKDIDGFLKYQEIPSNWHEARLRCHMEGSTLASPLTLKLRNLMQNLVKQSKAHGIFTGIHSKFSRGDMHSVEGTHLSNIPHSFAFGEPNNNHDQENCILMLENGNLADVSCDETLPYVCYKENSHNLILNVCGTVDNEYILNQTTGSCYKLHSYPRTWSRAFMTCTAEGGHLAVINSDEEATVIKELYYKYTNLKQVGDYVTDIAFVGFHDWDEHGEWRTVHGETLQEAGYDKFKTWEPNNASVGEFCGGIFRSGYLDDLWCYKRANFFCEKDPTSLLCADDI